MDLRTQDRRWLGLEINEGGRFAELPVRPDLVNVGGVLYGGTAVAAAVTLMESVTDRFMVWTTVQFTTTSGVGDTLQMQAVVSAEGRRSSQLRVIASVDGREVFVALGAVGTERSADLNGQWAKMPDVEPPEGCPPLSYDLDRVDAAAKLRQIDMVDRRLAVPRTGDIPNRLALWSRMPEHPSTSAAMLGWHADLLGMAIVKAKPEVTGGTSLDNTIRFGRPVNTEWVLVDIHAHLLVEGYGHGTVDVWAPDGTLMATGGQTCMVRPRPSAGHSGGAS